MRFNLGSVARGLAAGAIIADGGALLAAWNGTSSWHVAIGVVVGNTIALAAALVDPGKPA